MTRIIKKKMYCPNCKQEVLVPIMASTNSTMIKNDPLLARKLASGRMFGYSCPNCNSELESKENE